MLNSEMGQPVFRALSDPTRRAIIEMLAGGDKSIGEIAGAFDMTRPAVAKHLAVLKEGGVVTVQQKGRERINRLEPAALKTAADWLSLFDRFWDDNLARLKEAAEAKENQ